MNYVNYARLIKSETLKENILRGVKLVESLEKIRLARLKIEDGGSFREKEILVIEHLTFTDFHLLVKGEIESKINNAISAAIHSCIEGKIV